MDVCVCMCVGMDVCVYVDMCVLSSGCDGWICVFADG